MDLGGRVQFLQAQLFPVCPLTPLTPNGGRGFLGSFLSKGLKTNQLEVNTDEKTLRPIARLKEPRDLFALPKDKDHDCSQQAPRWPIECQVIEERIAHIPTVPTQPEPFYQPTGKELKPNPVGEENGIVVFNYNPISAVNYDKTNNRSSNKHQDDDSSDSDVSSCESQGSTPDMKTSSKRLQKNANIITQMLTTLEQRSSSNSNGEDDDDEDDTDNDEEVDADESGDRSLRSEADKKPTTWADENPITEEQIDDIWANKSPEYRAATPTYIRNQFGKDVIAQKYGKVGSNDLPMGFEEKLIAGLQVVLSNRASSTLVEGNTDRNEDGHHHPPFYTVSNQFDMQEAENSFTSEYAKLKANPIFNPDMSLNLQELARPRDDPNNDVNNWTKAKNPKRDPCPSCSTTTIALNGGIENRFSFSLNPNEDTFRTSCSSPKAPCSCSHNQNQNFISNQYNSQANANATQQDCSPRSNAKDKLTKSHYLPQFSRSAVGGSKFLTNCHPYNPEEYDGLEFESRFESGNLAKAVQITPAYYELYLRPDLYTSRSRQWFYFRVRKTKRNMLYRFSIVNLIKSDSLYNDGMRPLMYSTHNAKTKNEGWVRCGDNICYYRNDDDNQPSEEEEDNSSYTLTFNVEFQNDNDTVYFAHSYPYTYSDLQDYLMEIQKNPTKSKFCKLRLLCRTLAGNNVYYLTVTTPAATEELMKRKKSIVISARVHPSETPSSWMMKGLMDFITGDSSVAKRLRHKFIFKLIPMLNPDGVIVGNSRNSLTGKDLNRQYRTVIRETYPSIWYTKALIKRLIDECGVSMYCDMHAHSRRHNIFIYGCENKRNPEKKLTEQVFPLMLHKNVADKFSFENCKFKIQRSKEGTGRIVVWMLGITNSYTIEASFGGSLLGSRKGTHFTTQDYEHMGRAFCETLLDYCDDNPNKVKRNAKLLKRIKKIRKREKREQKALKLKKLAEQECLRLKIIERLLKEGSSAEEPINIPLSDYSSDEGSSSSSDNEGKGSSSKDFSDLEGPCCHPLKAPPCSPELDIESRKPHKLKVRCKSLHRRKKEERLLLDLPTTDPGSDLVFSTDDEYIIDSNGIQCYGTMPRHIRRGLMQSELQRRYIEEMGDGLRNMPPELIITSPSNKSKHAPVKILFKPTTKKYVPPKSAELPLIGGPARRTSSWHNLNTASQTPVTPQWYSMNMPRQSQSPSPKPVMKTKTIAKKEPLSKEDLDIKLSLKKKIWTGIQPEDGLPHNGVDRNKPLSWVPPPPLKTPTKKNEGPSCSHNNTKRLENEAFLTACSQKLLEWQMINSNEGDEETTGLDKPTKLPLALMMPELNEDHTMRIFKHLAQIKKPPKPKLETETKIKQKRNVITKVSETTNFIAKLSKTKTRTNLATSHRGTLAKQTVPGLSGISQHKSQTRNPNKFKTGGIVATAVQPTNTKNKTKKLKSSHKLSSGLQDAAMPPLKINGNNTSSSGGGIVIASTATTIVRKVKTKLKKKKSSPSPSTIVAANTASLKENNSTLTTGYGNTTKSLLGGSCSS
ncbi:cytosolic carboxypeptidase Nna1 isoform X3 [Stomoxys calcitrans]|uniref:cytosolic carboxypeptidase Nna1 isoform X3 n=1 Tax=Stomoxys calcitrans TaxID=35570 RepID=UPI0027E22E9E|nr:cytosolic carboxypeptidase Nna1 isoform X3 [Stomoxys calcitrans]